MGVKPDPDQKTKNQTDQKNQAVFLYINIKIVVRIKELKAYENINIGNDEDYINHIRYILRQLVIKRKHDPGKKDNTYRSAEKILFRLI